MIAAPAEGGPAPVAEVSALVGSYLAQAPDDLQLVHYGEVCWDADRLRSAVAALAAGFGAGRRQVTVAAVMRNHPWHTALICAALRERHCLVVLSPLEPDARTIGEVIELRPDALVAEAADLTPELRAAAAECGAVVVELPSADSYAGPTWTGTLRDAAESAALSGVAILMLTSGTTGPAKRVPVRFGDLDNALIGVQTHYVGRAVAGRRNTGVICPLPPVTISGLWAIITALAGGAPVVLMDRFDAVAFADAVEVHQPRTVSLPPAALRMILDAGIAPERLAGVTAVWSGAAPLDPALGARFEQTYHVPVLQSYGATEFTGGIAGWSLNDWKHWGATKRGSVGRLHAAVNGQALDPDTHEVLAAGQTGLLAFQSPHSVGATTEEWILTNDLGRVDADRFLFIDGRADDVINRGGFKISAGRLKGVLESHPSIREAAVVPVPDERLGEAPAALLVAFDALAPPDPEEMAAWVREQLPPYYVPVTIRFAPALPRNGALKIIRPAVAALLRDDGDR